MAYISNIQHLSTSDGPGIRSTVFLMGCGLRCSWCHNPENFQATPVLSFNRNRCIGCGNCLVHCPQGAVSIVLGTLVINRELCNNCGACVSYCYQNALQMKGLDYTVDTLLQVLIKYKPYYLSSGGGVTFSGGEPLLHQGFLRQMIQKLQAYNIDVIIETSLSMTLEPKTEQALRACSLLYVDIKKMNSFEHYKWTGRGNEKIFENIKKLDGMGIPLYFRTPIVPGVNDTKEDVASIARFVCTLNHAKGYELIPYHPLGLPKYEQVGLSPKYTNSQSITKNRFKDLVKYAEKLWKRGE